MRRRPLPLGARGFFFLAILAAGTWAAAFLGLFRGEGAGRDTSASSAAEFFAAAFRPALVSQAPEPFGGASLLPGVFEGMHRTVVFASAALGIAVVMGLLMGFLGSTAWWSGEVAGGASPLSRVLRRAVLPLVYGASRVVIALLRSVHEIIWAILFLAAFGRSNAAAVLAIAIPIAGTLAKIFSELIDEAPRDAAVVLRGAGAGPASVFTFGLLPRALPDMMSNLFYQFECAIRSSAVLGFFGFPTLGYYISGSFENLYYREVWTYLYALLFLVVAVEVWSAAIRRGLR